MIRVTLLAVAISCGPASAAAGPSAATLEAWNAYVHATEARRAREGGVAAAFLARDFGPDGARVRRAARDGALVIGPWQTSEPRGRTWEVPDGQIHQWVGTVFVPGVGLDALLDRLQGTDVQARQPDVLASRVLARHEDGLEIYLRLRRSQVVTVTYDTEHRVRFRRISPSRAESTTVATRIAELDHAGTDAERRRAPGDDRGFLWRLNAYWRYEAVPGGILVECESLSLSRSVPFGLGAVVGPFVTRVARDSMARTLETLRTVLGRPPRGFTARGGAL